LTGEPFLGDLEFFIFRSLTCYS